MFRCSLPTRVSGRPSPPRLRPGFWGLGSAADAPLLWAEAALLCSSCWRHLDPGGHLHPAPPPLDPLRWVPVHVGCTWGARGVQGSCTVVTCRLSAGSYQVYSIYPPDYQRNETDPSGPPQDGVPAENATPFREGGRFCNRSLYLLAFWTTTIVHVLAGSTLLGTLCLCASMKGVEVFVQHLQP